jgi:SAM-dependent methyltransferase
MRAHLFQYCRAEIADRRIVALASPMLRKVRAITANFAVLNHFPGHELLFEQFSRVVEPGGFVLASMLDPWYLADMRRRWWWANLPRLLRTGHYAGNDESGVHRFAPRAVARAAAPHFRLESIVPQSPGLAWGLYMFLLLRRA